jgi:HAE1 family hydrophobic/amphiphilic exporter-1
MNLSRFAVNRPIFTVMVCLIVILLGGISLTRLPVDLMPDISYPTLSVSTTYENASPEEIEQLITRPIEEAMSAVPGVEEVTSTSSEGRSNVRVTFNWGTNLDEASNDVRDRLDRVIPRLPDDADRPSLRKFDLASFPIVILGASSRLDPVQMRRLIDDEIKYRIERVPGVAALDVWGGLEREIHVNLDADKLMALQIPLDQILTRIRTANITLPAGSIETGQYDILLRTLGEYSSLDQLRRTAIAVRNGTPILLENVADITDRWQKITRSVKVNGDPGVRLSVNKQSGTNTVEVARRVLAEVEKINEDIPQLRLIPIIDTSDYIRRSITNTGSAAIYGGLFALVILFLFLRSLRSTVVIGVAIPISIVGTFALIYFNGFTLNLMTLGGLALGVGMLLDSAIVVLENIHYLREKGVSAREAAVRGAQQMTAPIIASTLTTLVVFMPLVLVRGMAGIMFKQLALVISFALLSALVVALTVIPMLASRFMVVHPPSPAANGEAPAAERGLLASLERFYGRLLHAALRHRWVTLFLSLGILGSSLLLIPWVGVELMPQSDESEVRIEMELEVGTRLGVTEQTLNQIEEIVRREVPEIKSVVSSAGGSGWRAGGAYQGQFRIALVPQAQRQRSSEQIANDLRRSLAGIPGATIRTRAGQGLFILRQVAGGTERIEVEIRGYDLEVADRLARDVKRLVEEVPNVTDTVLSREIGAPERIISVDRAKAEAMQVSVRQVADVLQTALSGTRAGYFREGGKEYGIRVQLAEAEKRSLREILDLTLINAGGQAVVLRNIVAERERSGPVLVERKDQERIVTVRANIQGRDMGSILRDIREKLRALPIPRGFSVGFGGDFEEQQQAFSELRIGFILALLLVYMVMACLYESLRDPFVVMFSVPMATIGVILILFLTGTTFNLQTYIGCIMLGGIVVNNAILLVDYTNRLRREQGMSMYEALEEAGRRRLRPILMTTLTTTCGLFPLALGLGEGGEAQSPMARAVIGGLLSSTLITLVFVPIVYSFIGDRPSKENP